MRGKRSSVEQLHAVARYEEIRAALRSSSSADYLDKPLAHWVLPADRRLPIAFLERPLGSLLEADFEQLAATPGVGRKKIRSLLDLLARVADSIPSRVAGNGRDSSDKVAAPAEVPFANDFDADNVSELVWSEWQETVQRWGLGDEPLGRVAPTLKNVTRVIWHTPLSEYLGVSLADLRKRKTYGEKRVRAVLKIFFGLHQFLSDLGTHEQLTARLVPRNIDRAERWIARCLRLTRLPESAEIAAGFVTPLIHQLTHDASRQIVEFAEIRLGVGSSITTVRQTAQQMSLTRARIYQLMNEISDILSVRWPLGRCTCYQLLDWMEAEAEGATSLDLFRTAVDLFYPSTRGGAAGTSEGDSSRSVA